MNLTITADRQRQTTHHSIGEVEGVLKVVVVRHVLPSNSVVGQLCAEKKEIINGIFRS